MAHDPWKLKPAGQWHDRPRTERLGHVLYAHLSDPQTQKTMLALAKLEGKQNGLAARMNVRKPKDQFKLRGK